MGRYRKIDTRIWNDAKFNTLSERGKLVFFFGLTHPNLTMLGAMRASVPGLAAEIRMSPEAFREAFQEAISKGMAKHDEDASFLWFPNFLKYNKPESPNVVKAWPDAFDLIPECQLKQELFQQVEVFAKGLTEAFRKAFDEAFAKTMPNQEQEQEQEQETTTEPPPAKKPTKPLAVGAKGEFMCAVHLMQELKLAATTSDIGVIAQVIALESPEYGGEMEAAQFIQRRAVEARKRGEHITVFWIKDRKFATQESTNGTNRRNTASPASERLRAGDEAIAAALARRGISPTVWANGRIASSPTASASDSMSRGTTTRAEYALENTTESDGGSN